jgi:hypothetical protein
VISSDVHFPESDSKVAQSTEVEVATGLKRSSKRTPSVASDADSTASSSKFLPPSSSFIKRFAKPSAKKSKTVLAEPSVTLTHEQNQLSSQSSSSSQQQTTEINFHSSGLHDEESQRWQRFSQQVLILQQRANDKLDELQNGTL